MAKSHEFIPSESGNWNINLDYSKNEILKHIVDASFYEELAEFGTTSIIDEFTITESERTRVKILALKRFRKKLTMLIRRTHFAVKLKDRPLFLKHLESLDKLKDYMSTVEDERTKMNSSVNTSLNQKEFDKILDTLTQIQASLLEPLNKADIIFSYSEATDPKEYKKQLLHRISTQP